MGRLLLFCCVLFGSSLLSASIASADQQTLTLRHGPIKLAGWETNQNAHFSVPTPQLDGFITHMSVQLVDSAGRPVPAARVMMHHLGFGTVGRHDATCSSYTTTVGSKAAVPAIFDRFYGASEEREGQDLSLPNGYGYPIRSADKWMMLWMLMNHTKRPTTVYIRYTVTVDTSPDLTAVTPVWLGINDCQVDPIYDVPGGSGPGSLHRATATVNAPLSGRVVGGTGHLHGGGRQLVVSQPRCGDRELVRSDPKYGLPDHPYFRVRPVMHEPGPIAMSRFYSQRGISISRGEPLKLTSIYDAEQLHTRVMGFEVLYVAADPEVGSEQCHPLPEVKYSMPDLPGRTNWPGFTTPLTQLDANANAHSVARPPGPTARASRSTGVSVGSLSFSKPNLLVARNTKVSWRFPTDVVHNVTVVNGPTGFSSVNRNSGATFTHRFTKPGTYKIFCSLHPVQMTESVVVR